MRVQGGLGLGVGLESEVDVEGIREVTRVEGYEGCCYPGITDFIVNSKNNCDKRNGKIIRGTVIRETAIRGTILRGTIITVMSTLKFGLSLVK